MMLIDEKYWRDRKSLYNSDTLLVDELNRIEEKSQTLTDDEIDKHCKDFCGVVLQAAKQKAGKCEKCLIEQLKGGTYD